MSARGLVAEVFQLTLKVLHVTEEKATQRKGPKEEVSFAPIHVAAIAPEWVSADAITCVHT